MKRFVMTTVAAAAVALSGCASIMGQQTQLVPIASTPSEATISIVDEAGIEIFKGNTPTTVTLPKSTGRYWGKKSYTVTITKPGFQDQKIPVTASANGWYLVGNAVFGGLLGWFVIDPFGGHMYTLSPENVSASLGANAAHNNAAKDGSITIVMLEDVPAEARNKLVRVY